jgi:3-oxoacyl-[acyl-carrier protein] reductase
MSWGRVALVTGAGRGIGAAIATRFAADGVAVAVAYRRDRAAAEATVADIEAAGGTASAFQVSIGEAASREALVNDVLGCFGHVDVFVSNAGIASSGRSVVETRVEEVERLFGVHTIGAFDLCRRVIPQMRGCPRGDIVFISSTSARIQPPGHAPYTMAKVALEALAVTLAKEEAGNGIRVNIVRPGLIATEMGDRLVAAISGGTATTVADLAQTYPLGREGRPEDVAAAVSFLVSADATHMTGQRISVDGGKDDVLQTQGS